MKATSLLLLFVFSTCVSLVGYSQDTTFVQTFTFDDITKRRDMFNFPAPNESYRKVLMYKTLKCDPATTQDQFQCGEWDYLTYTFLYDHTGEMDSTESTHSRFLGGGYDFDTVRTHNTPMYDAHRWFQTSRVIDSVITDSTYAVFGGSATSTNALASDSKSSRFQFIIEAAELTAAGLSADTIDKLSLDITQLGSALKHFTIRMRNHTSNTLDQMESQGMTKVYEANNPISATGVQAFTLWETFAWDGTSNVLVELSFTNDDAGTAHAVSASNEVDTIGFYSNGSDGYVVFEEDRNRIEIPLSSYDFGDEITISFWMNGDANILPVNTSIFEGIDFNNVRALNAHLPWSNGSAYWDAGSGAGYDRINKAANASDYEGQWNHWAFTKNAGTGQMAIYLNGVLWQSGTDKNRTIGVIKQLIIGSATNGNPWYGKVDEFRVWKKELDGATISNWMYRDVTASHANYNDMAVYLKFDDGYSLTNSAPSSLVAYWHGAPRVSTYAGTEIFKNGSKTTVVPNVWLSQGEYTDNVITDTLFDTVLQKPFSVVEYAVSGNHVEAVNGTYASPEGYSYVYNQNGNAIDSTYYAGTTIWINEELTFFYPPYDVVDRYEIGRFITPYGIGLTLGPKGFTWIYDVTDYAHLLRDSVDLSSGNQQELLDLKFAFIDGTPPANVVELTRPWGQSGSKRYSALDDDDALAPTTIDIHPSAKRQKVIARLTGHGHNSNTGNYPHCCEWKDNTHSLYVDGFKASDWHIWQTHECALNPVYPQGGTWPGAREGWCPGDLVKDFEYDISSMVSGSDYELDYRITPVPSNNAGMGNGNYVVAMHVIQYDEPAHALDAEVYDVISPSKRGYYSRKNPVCYAPKIVLRNNGSTTMTSATISYQVQGGIPKTYEWTGSLGFLEKEEVELPFQDGAFYMGDGSNKFTATVSAPNGSTDGYSANDAFTSNFDLPELYEGEIIIQFKTNANPSENSLILYNAQNTPILIKNGSALTANTLYWDTLSLDTGCYRLEVTDNQDDGLSYWANPNQGSGYLRIWNDGGIAESFESEFGNKIEFAFAIDAMTIDTIVTVVNDEEVYVIGGDTLVLINGTFYPLTTEELDGPTQFGIYPNPNAGSFYVELLQYAGVAEMEVYSLSGQRAYKEQIVSGGDFAMKFNLKLSSGVYIVKLKGEGLNEVRKIVVER